MPATEPLRTLRPVPELDYHHSRSLELPVELTPLQGWNLMMAHPGWLLRLAFRIRDEISVRFGVKRISGFSGKQRETVAAGDRLDFFLVEHSDPDVLILTERDRHLDVMICVSTAGRRFVITSSVVVHNTFGRIYMWPVGLAHKLIVASYLGRLKRRLAEAGGGSAHSVRA